MGDDRSLYNPRGDCHPILPPHIEETKGVVGTVVIVAPAVGEVITEAIGLNTTPARSEADI